LKRILILGAYGYIGAKLSQFLSTKGFSVIAFGKTPPPVGHFWYNNIEDFIVGDIRDESILNQICSRNYDVVINLISLDYKNSEISPIEATLTNVIPSWNILDRLVINSLKLFIYFSTVHVYGKLNNSKTNQLLDPKPNSKYALTHLLSEKVVDYYHNVSNVKCINLRVSNGYGSPFFENNNCWSLVVNDICKSAFEKKKIIINSDGSPKCDFIHISDICKAIDIIINKNNSINRNLFNLSSNGLITISELAILVQKTYLEKYGEEIPIIYKTKKIGKKKSSKEDNNDSIIDNKKLKKLGFEPTMNLKDGVREIFQYLETS